MAPVASIDHGRLCVKVPDGCEQQSLFEFLWSALARSDGRSIHFAFAAQDDTLRVIYMARDCVGYAASAPVRTAKGGMQLGAWTIERMPLGEQDERRESRRTQLVLIAMLQAASSAGMPKERCKAIYDDICGYYRRVRDGADRGAAKCGGSPGRGAGREAGLAGAGRRPGRRARRAPRVRSRTGGARRDAASGGTDGTAAGTKRGDLRGSVRLPPGGCGRVRAGLARAVRGLLAMSAADLQRTSQEYRRSSRPAARAGGSEQGNEPQGERR